MLFLVSFFAHGQDTAAGRDTLLQRNNATITRPKPAFSLFFDSSLFNKQPFFSYKTPLRLIVSKKQWEGKERFFYAAVALLLFFALLRNNFGRYFQDLFGMFFQTSFKQRQIKEQMMQAPLASLMLNILFFLNASLFIALWLVYSNTGPDLGFLPLFLYCILGLLGIYTVKFLTLKLCGWVFRVPDATNAYTFIVFTTNKVIGIALLPFIILVIFTSGSAQQLLFTISLVVVCALFFYRFFLSYATIHRQIRINLLHFVLYLAAFEIVPLLLINKVLFKILGESS